MKKTNAFAAWSGHRLFHVVAGTLVGVMAVTQASAMLPTPEPTFDSVAAQTPANMGNSNAQAVTSRITASIISVGANGRETMVPVDGNTRLQSGNILEYQGLFTNTNPDRVSKMTVTMSIPQEVELLGGIAPEFPLGSVDGSLFAGMPLKGQINGQVQEIPMRYYRAVRWNLGEVGLNDTVIVKYRARVL